MKQKDLLLIAIFTFITVLAWVIFDLYHVRVTSTLSPVLKESIKPIEPHFDVKTIEALKNQRKTIEPPPETATASPSPTVKLSESQTASPGGSGL